MPNHFNYCKRPKVNNLLSNSRSLWLLFCGSGRQSFHQLVWGTEVVGCSSPPATHPTSLAATGLRSAENVDAESAVPSVCYLTALSPFFFNILLVHHINTQLLWLTVVLFVLQSTRSSLLDSIMLGKRLSSISCKYFICLLCLAWMYRTYFTILLLSSLMNEVVHTSPTIGSNVEEIVVKNTHFLMWDIGGQESLRSSWNTYYSNTEVSGMFSDFSLFTESHNRGTEVLSGSWRICSAHTRQQGRPGSRVIFWTKVPAWKAERQIRFSAGRGLW